MQMESYYTQFFTLLFLFRQHILKDFPISDLILLMDAKYSIELMYLKFIFYLKPCHSKCGHGLNIQIT